uniref:Uncharacterized protein n=1 Tax=Arundo donax TaxID=35708 RepID=A0A0A9E2P5_ARUDO
MSLWGPLGRRTRRHPLLLLGLVDMVGGSGGGGGRVVGVGRL